MQALTKNDMKPSRAPCFFSKSSFSRSRSAMTLVMSTSLKVVSMAAVFCASFRRLAMVRRSRVMRTRSSRSARGRGPAGTAGLAAGAADGAGIEDSAAITSALVARPSLPVGWIAAARDARLLGELAHGRAGGGEIGGRRGRRHRRPARAPDWRGRRRGLGRGGRRRRRSGGLRRRAGATGFDVAEHAADLHGGAFLDGEVDDACRPPSPAPRR